MIRYINAHPTYICSVAYEGWMQARKACGFDPGIRTITLYAGKTIWLVLNMLRRGMWLYIPEKKQEKKR